MESLGLYDISQTALGDNDHMLNKRAVYNGNRYRYCKLASGSYLRKHDPIYINKDGTAVISSSYLVNGYVPESVAEVDATSADTYFWAIEAGKVVNVAVSVAQTGSLDGKKLVAAIGNSKVEDGETATLITDAAGTNTQFDATTTGTLVSNGVAGNLTSWLAPGDIVIADAANNKGVIVVASVTNTNHAYTSCVVTNTAATNAKVIRATNQLRDIKTIGAGTVTNTTAATGVGTINVNASNGNVVGTNTYFTRLRVGDYVTATSGTNVNTNTRYIVSITNNNFMTVNSAFAGVDTGVKYSTKYKVVPAQVG